MTESTGLLWNGRPIEELSREELIEALAMMAKDARQAHETVRKITDVCSMARGANGRCKP